jgi:hypothetical protein
MMCAIAFGGNVRSHGAWSPRSALMACAIHTSGIPPACRIRRDLATGAGSRSGVSSGGCAKSSRTRPRSGRYWPRWHGRRLFQCRRRQPQAWNAVGVPAC